MPLQHLAVFLKKGQGIFPCIFTEVQQLIQINGLPCLCKHGMQDLLQCEHSLIAVLPEDLKLVTIAAPNVQRGELGILTVTISPVSSCLLNLGQISLHVRWLTL